MSFGSPLLMAFARAAARPAPVSVDDSQVVDDPLVPAASDPNEPRNPSAPTIPVPVSVTHPKKRKLQCVNTKAAKVKVLKWMQEQFDQRGTTRSLMSETVKHFPEIFRAESHTANLMKVSWWWQDKEELKEDYLWDTFSISQSLAGWRQRVELKARPGRGKKVSPENQWLYPLVRNEFERLRKSGVKFSPGVLLMMARNVLMTSPHPTFGPSSMLGTSGKSFLDRLTLRWVQQFQESQGIVHRCQTGKLSVSPEKTVFIERAVAYHMGQLARGFASGEFQEDLMENMDETHFVVNMDNGKTLGFRGDIEVKYADVVLGGIGITMALKVTGGRAGKICTPMMIFQNLQGSYPIRGTPDNIPGVCYRSSQSSFMTSELLTEYYSEPRVSWADPSGRTKIQYIDNYPGHNVIPSCTTALARIRTSLRYFPANSTHLTQPCDSFVISKVKDAWRRRWDAKKMEMIQDAMWQGDGRDRTSGALKNPGWGYFLQLAADSVRDVNAQRDEHYGISYARKAMIRTGMSLNLDWAWDVKQLTPELQEIIGKYKENFEGSTEGLTSEAPGPRPVRSSRGGSARARGRAGTSNDHGDTAGRGRGRGRGRGQGRGNRESNGAESFVVGPSIAGPSIAGGLSIAGPSVAAGPSVDAVPSLSNSTAVGVAITSSTTTWISSRPGARAHRQAARRTHTVPKSNFYSIVESQGTTLVGGESSNAANTGGIEDHGTSAAFQDAQGSETYDTEAVAGLEVDPGVWGFLESQYNL